MEIYRQVRIAGFDFGKFQMLFTYLEEESQPNIECYLISGTSIFVGYQLAK